jgi:hypothetical protein
MMHSIVPVRQWRTYDCGAAVLRMGVRHLAGVRLSWRAAIDATGCQPEGVSFARLKKAFRRFGLSVGRIERIRSIRQALDSARLVVIDDNKTYSESHVILIIGHTRKHLWVIDPMVGFPTLRSLRRVVNSADEAFSIYCDVGKASYTISKPQKKGIHHGKQ